MRKTSFLYSAVFACFFLFFLFTGQSICISTVPSGNTFSKEFYYFNPDSPQSNLGRLKQEFETYFSRNNFRFSFQPFTHFVDFHRLNNEKRPAFILVPEWYYRKYREELKLHPLLIPVRNGSTSYEKILLVSETGRPALNEYEIVSFAMTTMGPDGETSFIKELVADELVSIEQLNVINVPKDFDAILALVLGQVKMALVAQDNLEVIADVNPRITQSLKKIDGSVKVSMPVLCYLEGRAETGMVKKLTESFHKMTSEQPRNKIMEMLQIDDWQSFTQ
ncbi:MAG: hypothetical protein JRF02_07520 [Deltaproteobacteria bacterium]|nr:hypothetical protein [Deltaproteobacteria bacterium]